MSLLLIQDAAREVRRLAIAGSRFAPGDFRLAKLVEPLRQAGVKVPVFAQVADAVRDLVEGDEISSPGQLLRLSTLLNAILYTQGKSSAEGELRILENPALPQYETFLGSRELKSILEALTKSGSGRMEVIQTALKQERFRDMRLVIPSVDAIGANYSELADFVAKQIIPKYGTPILPLLLAGFNPKGKNRDARTLRIMHQLDPDGTVDLCKAALDNGSPEVKVAAIGCLGSHVESLPLLLEESRSKQKQIRIAAMEALAGFDHEEVSNSFISHIRNHEFDTILSSLASIRSPGIIEALVTEGNMILAQLLDNHEGVTLFWEVLNCLDQVNSTQAEDFLIRCIEAAPGLRKLKTGKNATITGEDLVIRVTDRLSTYKSSRATRAILDNQNHLPPLAFISVFSCALRTWSSGKFYDQYGKLIMREKKDGDVLVNIMTRVMRSANRSEECSGDNPCDENSIPDRVKWHPGWLKDALESNRTEMVCALAGPKDKRALDYLLSELGSCDAKHEFLIVETLSRCADKRLTKTLLEKIRNSLQSKQSSRSNPFVTMRNIAYLPYQDLPELEAFAQYIPEKHIEQYLAELQLIGTKNPWSPAPHET